MTNRNTTETRSGAANTVIIDGKKVVFGDFSNSFHTSNVLCQVITKTDIRVYRSRRTQMLRLHLK